jgi:hypothetical protein
MAISSIRALWKCVKTYTGHKFLDMLAISLLLRNINNDEHNETNTKHEFRRIKYYSLLKNFTGLLNATRVR